MTIPSQIFILVNIYRNGFLKKHNEFCAIILSNHYT